MSSSRLVAAGAGAGAAAATATTTSNNNNDKMNNLNQEYNTTLHIETTSSHMEQDDNPCTAADSAAASADTPNVARIPPLNDNDSNKDDDLKPPAQQQQQQKQTQQQSAPISSDITGSQIISTGVVDSQEVSTPPPMPKRAAEVKSSMHGSLSIEEAFLANSPPNNEINNNSQSSHLNHKTSNSLPISPRQEKIITTMETSMTIDDLVSPAPPHITTTTTSTTTTNFPRTPPAIAAISPTGQVVSATAAGNNSNNTYSTGNMARAPPPLRHRIQSDATKARRPVRNDGSGDAPGAYAEQGRAFGEFPAWGRSPVLHNSVRSVGTAPANLAWGNNNNNNSNINNNSNSNNNFHNNRYHVTRNNNRNVNNGNNLTTASEHNSNNNNNNNNNNNINRHYNVRSNHNRSPIPQPPSPPLPLPQPTALRSRQSDPSEPSRNVSFDLNNNNDNINVSNHTSPAPAPPPDLVIESQPSSTLLEAQPVNEDDDNDNNDGQTTSQRRLTQRIPPSKIPSSMVLIQQEEKTRAAKYVLTACFGIWICLFIVFLTVILVIRAANKTSSQIDDNDNDDTTMIITNTIPNHTLSLLPTNTILANVPATLCYNCSQGAIQSIVAKSLLYHIPTADIAVIHAGIAHDEISSGTFTISNAYQSLPTIQRVITTEWTGMELWTRVEQLLTLSLKNNQPTLYPHWIGLQYQTTTMSNETWAVSDIQIEVMSSNDTSTLLPIELSKIYTIATTYDYYKVIKEQTNDTQSFIYETYWDATNSFCAYAIQMEELTI